MKAETNPLFPLFLSLLDKFRGRESAPVENILVPLYVRQQVPRSGHPKLSTTLKPRRKNSEFSGMLAVTFYRLPHETFI